MADSTSIDLQQQWFDTNRALEVAEWYEYKLNRVTQHSNVLRKRLNELASLQRSAEVRELIEAFKQETTQ